jgi:hypothetical protein
VNRNVAIAVAVVVVLLAGWWLFRSRQGGIEAGAIDLVELFPDAEKRTTMASLEDGYAILNVTIDGDRKRAIFAHPFSRITWTVEVPEGSRFRAAVALRPDAWVVDGDGALFRMGISDGATYTEFYKQYVSPHRNPADRRWFPIDVDLSAYAGRQVKVILNTEPGEGGNAVADACLWGEPRIVPNATDTH